MDDITINCPCGNEMLYLGNELPGGNIDISCAKCCMKYKIRKHAGRQNMFDKEFAEAFNEHI